MDLNKLANLLGLGLLKLQYTQSYANNSTQLIVGILNVNKKRMNIVSDYYGDQRSMAICKICNSRRTVRLT